MSFFDDFTDFVNQGAAAAQRSGRIAQIKFQIGDLDRQRRDLAAQLGLSIMEDEAALSLVKSGREELLDSIADLDAKKAEFEAEIEKIEAEAEAERQAAAAPKCPVCGGAIADDDKFCGTCGASLEKPEEPEAPVIAYCPNCGTPVKPTDYFCVNCGTKLASGADIPEPPLSYNIDE